MNVLAQFRECCYILFVFILNKVARLRFAIYQASVLFRTLMITFKRSGRPSKWPQKSIDKERKPFMKMSLRANLQLFAAICNTIFVSLSFRLFCCLQISSGYDTENWLKVFVWFWGICPYNNVSRVSDFGPEVVLR